jgi:hypothetical protein
LEWGEVRATWREMWWGKYVHVVEPVDEEVVHAPAEQARADEEEEVGHHHHEYPERW